MQTLNKIYDDNVNLYQKLQEWYKELTGSDEALKDVSEEKLRKVFLTDMMIRHINQIYQPIKFEDNYTSILQVPLRYSDIQELTTSENASEILRNWVVGDWMGIDSLINSEVKSLIRDNEDYDDEDEEKVFELEYDDTIRDLFVSSDISKDFDFDENGKEWFSYQNPTQRYDVISYPNMSNIVPMVIYIIKTLKPIIEGK